MIKKKGVDNSLLQTPWAAKTPNFGEVLLETECAGWVHAVAFSPSGNRMAFVGHDSSISFVDAGQEPVVVKLNGLPFVDVLFLDENRVVAAGHDCAPMLFSNTGGKWYDL